MILSAILLLLATATVQSNDFNAPGIYDPEGRLMQLESAIKASARGGSLLAVCGSEAIVLLTLPAADSKTRLILPPRSVRYLARGIGVAPVGITSDTTFLVDKCFEMVVSNSKTYDSKPSVRRVAIAIAEFMHDRTQDMASRPFGASLCLFGVTSSEPELFEVTPSGACTQKRVVGLGKFGGGLVSALSRQRRRGYAAAVIAPGASTARLAEECLGALRVVLLESGEEGGGEKASQAFGNSQDLVALGDCQARLHVIPTSALHDSGRQASELYTGSEGWEVDSGTVREALTTGDYKPLRALIAAMCPDCGSK